MEMGDRVVRGVAWGLIFASAACFWAGVGWVVASRWRERPVPVSESAVPASEPEPPLVVIQSVPTPPAARGD
jgi:hypothetical protein